MFRYFTSQLSLYLLIVNPNSQFLTFGPSSSSSSPLGFTRGWIQPLDRAKTSQSPIRTATMWYNLLHNLKMAYIRLRGGCSGVNLK